MKIVIPFLLIMFFACSNSENIGTIDTTKIFEIKEDLTKFKDFTIFPDVPVQTDLKSSDESFLEQDTEPIEGGFGWKCSSNQDCNSGWCIPSAQGMVCSRFCNESCDAGWVCKGIASEGTDPVFICVPLFPTLCNPCHENSDCSGSMSAEGNQCLEFGAQGNFCGGNCESSACPTDYECKEVLSNGTTLHQCMPVSGQCSCSKSAVQLGLSTDCKKVNEFGSCPGTRKCSAAGLTDCEAKTPDKEICNAIDDNCDGLTDNITIPEECKKSNIFGVCKGEVKCNDGVPECLAQIPAQEICDNVDNNCDGNTDEGFTDTDGDKLADCVDPDIDNDTILNELDNCPYVANLEQNDLDGDKIGDACDDDIDNDGVLNEDDCEPMNKAIFGTNVEICDNIDNNCNGETDEGLCDDGEYCTKDTCKPDGGCLHENIEGPCDDHNVCTTIDVCNNGKCIGKSKLNCDDKKPCTKDMCNPVSGCYWDTSEDGTPCSTGNLCSANDHCVDGKCMTGSAIDCNDGNECSKDFCDSQSGCKHTILQGNSCTYKYTWLVFDCEAPGVCGTSGCSPKSTSNGCGPNCLICVDCPPYLNNICLDGLLSGQ